LNGRRVRGKLGRPAEAALPQVVAQARLRRHIDEGAAQCRDRTAVNLQSGSARYFRDGRIQRSDYRRPCLHCF
jgi:hypothetical protein